MATRSKSKGSKGQGQQSANAPATAKETDAKPDKDRLFGPDKDPESGEENERILTHTADNGRLYVAQVLDDGSYSVTVTAGGQVLYTCRAANDDALNDLVA